MACLHITSHDEQNGSDSVLWGSKSKLEILDEDKMENIGNQILKGRDCRLNVNLITRQVGEYCNSCKKNLLFWTPTIRTCFSNIDIEINS